jgi:hypothetical protein
MRVTVMMTDLERTLAVQGRLSVLAGAPLQAARSQWRTQLDRGTGCGGQSRPLLPRGAHGQPAATFSPPGLRSVRCVRRPTLKPERPGSMAPICGNPADAQGSSARQARISSVSAASTAGRVCSPSPTGPPRTIKPSPTRPPMNAAFHPRRPGPGSRVQDPSRSRAPA